MRTLYDTGIRSNSWRSVRGKWPEWSSKVGFTLGSKSKEIREIEQSYWSEQKLNNLNINFSFFWSWTPLYNQPMLSESAGMDGWKFGWKFRQCGKTGQSLGIYGA